MNALLFSLIAAVVLLTSPQVLAADKKPAAAATATKQRPIPFYGNIGTVDKTANTIKVGKRVFHVTPDTKVTKDGKTATLKEAAPGDEVGGSYRSENGTLTLISLRIGPKPTTK